MTEDLFDTAEAMGIEVYYGDIPQCKAISIKDNICLDYSLLNRYAEERTRLAHELGHCATGAFYTRHSKLELVERQEYKADKWAAHKVLPMDALTRAVASGITTMWELADHFGVTEEYIVRALKIYRNEGLI